ncbi:MAG: class I SAM-dependent methyltransferase [Gammaproteobacteria bacterium]|nr:class I SAM-dependent methyltransferase [Gammaproteobacteria bacterium]MDH3552101.1 class I SAM-dependent methyltransferase [Gammaproteobacteria bacterium]
MPVAANDFDAVRSSGFINELVAGGNLVAETIVDKSILGRDGEQAAYVLEHPKLPFVSYPYEWSFEGLKKAALLHLEIQQAALHADVALTDATAYNIQFVGPKPIFIDSLSFRPYADGEYWAGHRQFCEQFINPLLLRAAAGLAHNAWFRGSLEGISAEETSRVLPWHSRLSWNTFTNVFLQARLQRSSAGAQESIAKIKARRLPRIGFEQILHGLHRWIGKLKPKTDSKTVWADYAQDNSYAHEETEKKRAFVADFVGRVQPGLILDIGCNTGDYSALALATGANLAIGFDFDHSALDAAFRRAEQDSLNFLPLHLDAANPSPNQGWLQAERLGFQARAKGDAVLALALVHHLAIAKNLPLGQIVDWLVSMAPQGVIEFVPKSDPMVQRLLQLREDLFDDYDGGIFENLIGNAARIVRSETVSSSARTLYWYDRS